MMTLLSLKLSSAPGERLFAISDWAFRSSRLKPRTSDPLDCEPAVDMTWPWIVGAAETMPGSFLICAARSS